MRHLSLLVGIAVAMTLAVAADAGAQALRCGAEVAGDVELRADLRGCPGDGLVVTGSDVTVDLDGHRVDGSGTGAGIRVLAPGVTVRDGSITGFEIGVLLDETTTRDGRLAGLDIAGNGRGVHLGGSFDGGWTDASVAIVRSRIHHNAGPGVAAGLWDGPTEIAHSLIARNDSGVFFTHSRGPAVEGSALNRNAYAGAALDSSPGARLTGNAFVGNRTFGVSANRSGGLTLAGNRLTGNGTLGTFSGGAYVSESLATIEGNAFDDNRGFGLALYEPLDTRSRWAIHRNTANHNATWGITAAQAGFTGTGNVARHNGERAQCQNFDCDRSRRR